MIKFLGEGRIKLVGIKSELFLEMLTQDAEIHSRVVEGLPMGSQVVNIYYDVGHRIVNIVVHHPSFDFVGDDSEVPVFTLITERQNVQPHEDHQIG